MDYNNSYKNCCKCRVLTQVTDFYRDLSKKDGLSSYCKSCCILKSKQRTVLKKNDVKKKRTEYYLKNKERLLKRFKENRKKRRDLLGIPPKPSKDESKEKTRQYQKQYYLNNREKAKNACKLYQERHPNAKRQYLLWKLENPEKAKIYEEELRQIKLKKVYAKNAKRRATKLQQTPKWANLKAIQEFYMNCPNGYHVDHIIPLKGKNVRGLHILENLQYLPAIDNIKKGNRV